MTDFLDTPEGPDWLHDAINSLICGDNVTAPRAHGKSIALVTPQSLWEALAEHLGAQEHIAPLLTDNRECPIAQLLCEIVADGAAYTATPTTWLARLWASPRPSITPPRCMM